MPPTPLLPAIRTAFFAFFGLRAGSPCCRFFVLAGCTTPGALGELLCVQQQRIALRQRQDLHRRAGGGDVDLIGTIVAQEARIAGGEVVPNLLAVVILYLQIGVKDFSAVDGLISLSCDNLSFQMPSSRN
jgi:hypothetical protein